MKKGGLTPAQRALAAARVATRGANDNVRFKPAEDLPPTVAEAAQHYGVNKASVSMARTIIAHGTPEEVATIERGESGLYSVFKRVSERLDKPPNKPRTTDQAERARFEAEIWGRLKDSIVGLGQLPLPSDVARLASGNGKRREAVEARLWPALKWLNEFADEWRKGAGHDPQET